MTENPDAVKVAEDFCDAKGFEDYMLRAGAILGARAMQAAMPAPAGVEARRARRIEQGPIRCSIDPAAIEDAGAREGAAEPLTMPVAHDPRFPSSGGTTKTIDGTLYNAPTPAGAGDLVERLRGTSPRYCERTGEHKYDVFANRDGDEAASRIEALEAEVARYKRLLDLEAADHDAASTRATTAEADLAALRSEVERKDKALREARAFVQRERDGTMECICVLDKTTLEPIPETADPLEVHHVHEIDAVLDRVDAALAPAKAGG